VEAEALGFPHKSRNEPSMASSLHFAGELNRIASELAALLKGVNHQARMTTVALLMTEVSRQVEELNATDKTPENRGMFESPAISPSIMEWARTQFSEEEVVAGIREIRETGGLTLDDFYHELEKPATRP
jgi:hypothetical protein